MVPTAAVFVIGDDDGGVPPVGALLESLHQIAGLLLRGHVTGKAVGGDRHIRREAQVRDRRFHLVIDRPGKGGQGPARLVNLPDRTAGLVDAGGSGEFAEQPVEAPVFLGRLPPGVQSYAAGRSLQLPILPTAAAG